MRVPRAALVRSMVSAGCGPHYVYTRSSQEVTNAKSSGCDFAVTASLTDPSSYVELGVLDLHFDPARDIAAFKEMVRADVCQAGGDLVVTEINGVGSYVRGIVFKKRPSS
jgi:hypothetical protein